jgi:hypothetical protein
MDVDVLEERCRLPELSTCGDPHQMLAYFVTSYLKTNVIMHHIVAYLKMSLNIT